MVPKRISAARILELDQHQKHNDFSAFLLNYGKKLVYVCVLSKHCSDGD